MAKNSQFATRLACKFIKEQFGETVEKVCRQLLRQGRQNFGEVARGTGLPLPLVRHSLLALMQHNCVTAYTQFEDDGAKVPRPPQVLYEACTSAILQNIRKPKLLQHVESELGGAAALIVEVLLANGRLRLEQIVAAVADKLQKSVPEVSEHLRGSFAALVHAHYVERAPLCTLSPPAQRPHPNSVRSRKAPSAGTQAFAEQQAAAAAALERESGGGDRFKIPADLVAQDVSMAGAEDGGAAAAGTSGRPANGVADAAEDLDAPPPAKRPRKSGIKAGGSSSGGALGGGGSAAKASPSTSAAAAPAAPPQPIIPGAQLLWRVNYDEFVRRSRHAVCVALVKEKHGEPAAAIVAAMLEESRKYETRVAEPRSRPLNETMIHTLCDQRSRRLGEPSLSFTEVRSRLRALHHDALQLVSEAPGQGDGITGGAHYTVNSQRIVDLVRSKHVEAAVRDKFGVEGLRVYRLLAMRGQLEPKNIADHGMLPQKETRELLYRMLTGGFVAMQDIPRTSDHAPSRTFFTFRVDQAATASRVASELYRSAANVIDRLDSEMAKESEVLALIERAKETGHLGFQLTAAQRTQVERLQRVTAVLGGSLLALDDMIAVFADF